jgi:7,8-dihydro-6-hydroxymethylpterin-pyrophosphokinase
VKVRCISNQFQLVEDQQGSVRTTTNAGRTIWLDIGKVYEVQRIEHGWYRIIDESGEDYLYPPELFESLTV